MTPDLIVTWSGAKERSGEAPGLSSALIGSSARLCMEQGSNAYSETRLVRSKPLAKRRCRSCFRWFQPPAEIQQLKFTTHCADCTARDWSGRK